MGKRNWFVEEVLLWALQTLVEEVVKLVVYAVARWWGHEPEEEEEDDDVE